jgi:hypothetical protein
VLKVMFPGFCELEFADEPPGKTHEYFAAAEVVLKATDEPAVIVTSVAGLVMAPLGGEVVYGES